MLGADLVPSCYLRNNCARGIGFRDDPALQFFTPATPTANAGPNFYSAARPRSVKYIVDHICEPISQDRSTSADLSKPPQGAVRRPLTLNRRWYELNSCHRVTDIQRHSVHRTIPWMAAMLDGLVKETGAVFEAKFMLPWSFSEEAAAEKHMAQLQHNMLVAGTKKSVCKWIELSIDADPIYQTILIAAEKAFWRAVKTGETPALFDCEPPKPRIEAVRVVDMNASNS